LLLYVAMVGGVYIDLNYEKLKAETTSRWFWLNEIYAMT
jgi:hypothetical protein